MTTLELIELYRSPPHNWTFTLHSSKNHDGSTHNWWSYKSPRLASNGFIVEHFTEDNLLRQEAIDYTHDQHGASIAITMNSIQASVIGELAKLYLLRAQGKEGVEIPNEIVLTQVHIPIRTGDWKPTTKVEDGVLQEGQP